MVPRRGFHGPFRCLRETEGEVRNVPLHIGSANAHQARQHRPGLCFVASDDSGGGRDFCAASLRQRPQGDEREDTRLSLIVPTEMAHTTWPEAT